MTWAERVERYGKYRAVGNVRHSYEEAVAAAERLEKLAFPLFKSQLRGDEKLVLDFGCGWGRWTNLLAQTVGGRAIGVDPTPQLIALAEVSDVADFICCRALPLESDSVDVVWACDTICCVTDPTCELLEIQRVLKPGGLLFLIDNTSVGRSGPLSHSRSFEQYQALFPFIHLTRLATFDELGENYSVMAGRTV